MNSVQPAYVTCLMAANHTDYSVMSVHADIQQSPGTDQDDYNATNDLTHQPPTQTIPMSESHGDKIPVMRAGHLLPQESSQRTLLSDPLQSILKSNITRQLKLLYLPRL